MDKVAANKGSIVGIFVVPMIVQIIRYINSISDLDLDTYMVSRWMQWIQFEGIMIYQLLDKSSGIHRSHFRHVAFFFCF